MLALKASDISVTLCHHLDHQFKLVTPGVEEMELISEANNALHSLHPQHHLWVFWRTDHANKLNGVYSQHCLQCLHLH